MDNTCMLFVIGLVLGASLLSTRVCADFADTQDEDILIDEDVYLRGLFDLAGTDVGDDDDIGFDEEFDGERRAIDNLDAETRAMDDLDDENRAIDDLDDLDDEKRAMDKRNYTTARRPAPRRCSIAINKKRLPKQCKKCTKATLIQSAKILCQFKYRFKSRERVKRQTAADWQYWYWFCGWECK